MNAGRRCCRKPRQVRRSEQTHASVNRPPWQQLHTEIKTHDKHLGQLTGPPVVLPGQLCSGFAHGRPWAYLGASGVPEPRPLDVDHLQVADFMISALLTPTEKV